MLLVELSRKGDLMLSERHLTDDQKAKREQVVMALKKTMPHGTDEEKSKLYAIATAQALKEAEVDPARRAGNINTLARLKAERKELLAASASQGQADAVDEIDVQIAKLEKALASK
jgi:hypothetical protein